MTSELLYFDSDWEMTVFPQPKAPGMAVVPPCTQGKRASNTLCPVSNGKSAANFSAEGLGVRTGQTCNMVNLLFDPLNSVSSTVCYKTELAKSL